MIDCIAYSIALWLACGVAAVLWKGEETFDEWKVVMAVGPIALAFVAYFSLSGETKE